MPMVETGGNSPPSDFEAHLEWEEKPNNPAFLKLHPRLRKKMRLTVDLIVHPNDSGRIIVNYPGLDENINGLNSRYKTLAFQMQTQGLGAVVRSNNPRLEPFLPSANLKKTIDYTLENADLICKSSRPEVLLMGFSAGASAVAALASSYTQVTRILLIAPSGDMPRGLVEASLQKFAGEVYIVIGENDEVVSSRAGEIYYDLATGTSHRELFTIPNCDHYFQGEVNDMIFRKTPFYAFTQGKRPELS